MSPQPIDQLSISPKLYCPSLPPTAAGSLPNATTEVLSQCPHKHVREAQQQQQQSTISHNFNYTGCSACAVPCMLAAGSRQPTSELGHMPLKSPSVNA